MQDLQMDESPAPDSPALGMFSTVPASLEPIKGVFTKDVTIDAETNVWARIYVPVSNDPYKSADGNSTTDNERRLPVILFYHGGGFTFGGANYLAHELLCRRIVRVCQAVMVSTNYRKAPEFRCPTAYDDSYKTVEWLRSPGSKAHLPAETDISQCFLMGDSAGANIAHFLGCRIAGANDISPIQIRGILEIQPFFGGEDITPSEATDAQRHPPHPQVLDPQSFDPTKFHLTVKDCHKNFADFVGPEHNRDHPNGNVFGPNSSDISGLNLPPILVITGTEDVLIDRQVSYVQKLESMGKNVTWVNYDGFDHGFYMFFEDRAVQAVEKAHHFIRSYAS